MSTTSPIPVPAAHADPALGLLSLSTAAAPVPTAPVPIPIPSKPRPRSSFSQASRRARRPSDARDPVLAVPSEDRDRAASARLLSKSAPLDGVDAPAKKKGALFRCESCAKVYRHPSCLVKHRWEHSPHWREASKFLLSKHQQVQLLEAAAILSHLSPTAAGGGTSLPEDRSLWPAYLSGGRLPPALTQFRPGLLGHPNPGPSPPERDVWAAGTPHTAIESPAFEERGWSLPRSSVRGGSDDGEMEGVEEGEEGARRDGERERDGEEQVEEWDGMEMEMEI